MYPMKDSGNPKKIARAIATLAAENLLDLLGDARQVGIGWGYTIYETSTNDSKSQP